MNTEVQQETQQEIIVWDSVIRDDWPAPGEYLAVISEVIDQGRRRTPWGTRDQMMLVYLLWHEGSSYRMKMNYLKSLDERAKFVKDAKIILGMDHTFVCLPGREIEFNTNLLLGRNVNVIIDTRINKKGLERARIIGLSPARPDQPKLILKEDMSPDEYAMDRYSEVDFDQEGEPFDD